MAKEDYFKGTLEDRLSQLEERLAALTTDSTLSNLPYGTLKEASSMMSLLSIGNPLGGAYPAGSVGVGTSTTGVIAVNTLYAVPFYVPIPVMVSRIGMRVTVGAAGNVRLGIYEDKGENLLYPHKLVIDAGEISTSVAGVKALDIKQSLSRGLKWLAVVASGAPTITRLGSSLWRLLGSSEDYANAYNHYEAAFAYAALPNPFQAGAAENGGFPPYLFLKFA